MAIPRSSPYYYGGGGRAPVKPVAKPPARPAKSAYPKFVPPPRQPAAAPDYTQQATSDIAPLYAGLVSQLNAQRDIGEQGIQGYTKSFANMLGGYNPQAAYGKAAEAQAALDAALQQSLTGTGQNLSQGLAGQLAQINAPGETSSRVIGGLNAATTGAANAGLAKGSATLSALLAQGAAAGSYASQLPGYAAGLGLQQTRLLEGQTAQQVGQTLANEPKDVLSRADALQSAAASASDRAATAAYRQQQLGQGQQRIDASAAQARSTALYRKAQQGIATKKLAHQVYLDDQKLKQADRRETFAEWAKTNGLTFEGDRVRIAQQNADTSAARAARAAQTPVGGVTKLQSKTVNGHTVTFDPRTGTYYTPGTNTPVDPNTLTKPPKPVSAASLGKARELVYQNAHGYIATATDTNTPLTPSEARAAQNAGEDIVNVTVKQHQDDEIQKLYLELVQKYGIPARQAFQMVAGQFKQWGQAHQKAYFPSPGKAGAAQGVASPAAYIPGKFNGIDQGVDFQPGTQARAFAPGVVSKVSPAGSWRGGTGHAVYVTLATPVTVNGRTYNQIYYAEQTPLVNVGQRVNAGQIVMDAGGNEIGFAANGQPVGKYRGRGGQSYSQAGQDFADWLGVGRSRA